MASRERGRHQTLCYWKCWLKLFLTKQTFDFCFSILWHKVWVLIYNMFIFEKVGHSKFVEMHGDTSDFFRSTSKSDRYFFFYKLWSIYRTVADRPVSTLIPLQLEHRLWTIVVLFHCCTLIWGLTNNNYNLYLLQFMTVSVNIRSWYLHSLAIYI
jgi:hypothetical protein